MDFLSEIAVDLVAEIHSLLKTSLPAQWDFFKLNQNEDLSIILNNITYFTVYMLFLVWFVEALISSFQKIFTNRRLKTKDKLSVAVISMGSAMHVLWPLLLFITHFVTCEFYPWAVSTIVLILNISSIAGPIKSLGLFIYSKTPISKDYIKRIFTFGYMTELISEHVTSETGSSSSSEDNEGPSATPFLQPRMLVDENYKPSESPVLQPSIQPKHTLEEQLGPSQTPTIQPKIASEESYTPADRPILQPRSTVEDLYRPSDRSRIQPRLTSEKADGPAQSPIIQPKSTAKEIYRPSDRPRIQPKITAGETYESPERPRMQPKSTAEKPYKPSDRPRIQPRDYGTPHRPLKSHKLKKPRPLMFGKEIEESVHYNKLSDDSEASETEISSGYVSGKSAEHQKSDDENDGKNGFWKFKTRMLGSMNQYEDFKNELDRKTEHVKTSTPKKTRLKGSNEDATLILNMHDGHQSLLNSHSITYCRRCWKIVNQSFQSDYSTLVEARTTRLGTIYGPPEVFCECSDS